MNLEEVMEGRDPRDETDTWAWAVKGREEHFQAESDARDALEDAQEALGRWESAHELEYRMLFAQGERAELNRLDAEWNVLEDEREAAAATLAELEAQR